MTSIPARWAYLAVFVGVCGHASSEFFAVIAGASGPEVSVWRYLIGGAGLVAWALAQPGNRDLITPLREEGWRLVALSLVGISLAYLFFHWALDYATVIQVATFVTTMPIWVGLINRWLTGEPFTAVKIITGIMALLGIALLITDGYLSALAGEPGELFGIFLVLCTAALGSAYAVMIKPMVGRHGALRVTAVSLMTGGVGLWLMVGAAFGVWVNPGALFARAPSEATLGVNPGWWLLVLGLWNTTITQLCWFGGLSAAPDITRASYLFFLKPVIAALLAILVLAQYPTALEILAILVVTGSVLVEMFWPRIEPALRRLTA